MKKYTAKIYMYIFLTHQNLSPSRRVSCRFEFFFCDEEPSRAQERKEIRRKRRCGNGNASNSCSINSVA